MASTCEAFAEGHFHLLILVGAGGLAKSRSVRAVLGDGEACWIEGNATPFGMYAKLYRHNDEFVVIDDVDALYADRIGRAAPQVPLPDRGRKDRRLALRRPEPRAPAHPARVHDQEPGRDHLERLADAEQERRGTPGSRARAATFSRRPPRCTRRPGRGSTTQEIYGWFAKNLHRVREPSFRHYVRAKELKAAGMDWTAVLAAEDQNPRARLAAELLESTAYDSTAARVAAFVQQGGGCRATFFNYRRRLGIGNGRG